MWLVWLELAWHRCISWQDLAVVTSITYRKVFCQGVQIKINFGFVVFYSCFVVSMKYFNEFAVLLFPLYRTLWFGLDGWFTDSHGELVGEESVCETYVTNHSKTPIPKTSSNLYLKYPLRNFHKTRIFHISIAP